MILYAEYVISVKCHSMYAVVSQFFFCIAEYFYQVKLFTLNSVYSSESVWKIVRIIRKCGEYYYLSDCLFCKLVENIIKMAFLTLKNFDNIIEVP